jgi:hypothetical protein
MARAKAADLLERDRLIVAVQLRTWEHSEGIALRRTMALDLFTLIDHGAELLDWEPATVAGQQRMAADLKLLAELHRTTLDAGSDPAADS